METTLTQFIKDRAAYSFRKLLEELDGIGEAEAYAYTTENWPDHQWGIGQDGSIAGIVTHVAAWKEMTAPVFEVGGVPLTRLEYRLPNNQDWAELLAWLKRVGDSWTASLNALSDSEMFSTRLWEGKPMPVWRFAVEMYEHDVQHASQIAYLRQRIASER